MGLKAESKTFCRSNHVSHFSKISIYINIPASESDYPMMKSGAKSPFSDRTGIKGENIVSSNNWNETLDRFQNQILQDIGKKTTEPLIYKWRAVFPLFFILFSNLEKNIFFIIYRLSMVMLIELQLLFYRIYGLVYKITV